MQLVEILQLVSYIAVTISALTAIIAAIFISRQVANLRRNREVDTLMRIIALSDSERTAQAKEWMMYDLKPGITLQDVKANKETMAKFSQLVHLFETAGVLVHRGYVPQDLVFDKYGLLIAGAWDKLRPLIVTLRANKQSEEFAENFELLVKEYDAWAREVPLKVAKGERVRLKEARSFLDHHRNEQL